MPSLRVPVTIRDGARVRFRVSLSRKVVLALRRTGLAIPQPIEVDAVIDIGAECTCLDPGVIAQLQLPALGFGLTAAPAAGAPPVPALGGSTAGTFHKAGLTLLNDKSAVPGPDWVIDEVDVDSLKLSHFGIDALIGRDVLAGCVLVYDGPAGAVTLAY